MEPLVIKTERDDVLLRQCTEEDVPELIRLIKRNEKDSDSLADWGPDELRTYLLGRLSHLSFAIWHANVIIGHMHMVSLPAPYHADIGYLLDAESRGIGYATIYLRALVGFAFRAYVLVQISANADKKNPKSLRVLERAGFRPTSYAEGFCNYAIEREEWRKMSRQR